MKTTPDVVAPQFEMLEWAAQNPETTPCPITLN